MKFLFKNVGLFGFFVVNALMFNFGIVIVDVFILLPFKKRGFSFFFILELKLLPLFKLLLSRVPLFKLLLSRAPLFKLLLSRVPLFPLFPLFTVVESGPVVQIVHIVVESGPVQVIHQVHVIIKRVFLDLFRLNRP